MLIETTVFCKSCGGVISSRSAYLSKVCGCGGVSVMQGQISGKDYFDMSWNLDDEIVKDCINEIGGATEKKEVVMAVLSALRRSERIVADGEPKIVGFRDDQVMVVKNGIYATYKEIT